MENIQPIYPALDVPAGHDYRLTQVSHLKDQLQSELETRQALYKKYRRAVNILEGVDVGATALAVVLGGVGTGLLATIIATPVASILIGIGAGCGLVSGSTKVFTRRLRLKALKHDQIRVLAESKLNSISDLVSKSLDDGEISHEEFKLIVKEIEKYHSMKKDIRKPKKISELDGATKKKLIEMGRKDAHQSLLKKIEGGNLP